MKIHALLLLSLLTLLASCNGQTNTQITQTKILNGPATQGDTVKELGNNIMVIYQDKKNNYWFGSWRDGVYRYDGKTILHYTTKAGLPHNRIEEIKEDRSGNIYFNTSKGISKFDGQHFTTLGDTGTSGDGWKLNPDDLWFKSAQYAGHVYRYDGKTLYRLKLPKTKHGEDFLSANPGAHTPYTVYSVYKDSKGNIWFGTAVLGACRYNGKSVDWISEEDVAELHNGPANGVRSVIEDRDGYFWFNTMYRYNIYGNSPQKQPFYSKEKGPGSFDGKKEGTMYEYLSIAKDNSNALWIATYTDGVWRYDGKEFTHYPVQDEGKAIKLFYIYKDNKGDLWLGTHENGAFKFNGKVFERFKM